VDLLATRAGVPTLGEVKSTPSPPDTGDELPEEGRAVFQAARRDRDRGNTDLARQGFQEFLTKYGRSELADDALYYLGDLAFAGGEHQEALAHFRAMLEQFPGSELAPAALLKTGICLLEIGQKQAGRARLQELIARFPQTEEAALARERLAAQP
jgi:tol-pal system protein YbgF